MSKRRYTKVEVVMTEIKAMVAAGKTQRGITEHFRFKDKNVVGNTLHRERMKEAKLAAGIVLRQKGRLCKDTEPKDIVAEQAYEIKQLKIGKMNFCGISCDSQEGSEAKNV